MSRSFTYDGLSRLKTASGPWEKALGASGAVTWTYAYDALSNLRKQSSSRGTSGDSRTWQYLDPVRPHALTSFIQNYQYSEDLALNAYGEPSMVSRAGAQTPYQRHRHHSRRRRTTTTRHQRMDHRESPRKTSRQRRFRGRSTS